MRNRKNLPVLSAAGATGLPERQMSAIPQSFATPGLSLMQILSILSAYRLQALGIFLLLSIGMGVLIKLMPKTYSATATLMVSNEGNDPLGAGQVTNAPLFNYMSTEMQLMQSAEVLLPVIDQLKLTENKDYTGGYQGDGSTLRQWVKEVLVKDLDIQLGPYGSQLIYVTASARYPYLAALIANTLSSVYLTQQRQRVSGPASERAKRYALELGELKNKVRVAQEQVTAFRQRTGVTDTAEKNNNIEVALLASLEARLQEAQNARRDAEVKAAADSNLSAGAAGTAVVQNLKAQLNAQQTQLAQLRTTFGAAHPKVVELRSQIESTQRNLNAELHNYSAGASSDLTASRDLERKLKQAVEEQRTKVLGVNRLQDEGTKFELELESAQSVYKRALDGYDQIMFASGGQVANVSIVSSAVAPQKAAKPNKPKLFLGSALAAAAIALMAPLGFGLFVKRRVRCRDDFERNFAVPVLMEFDLIPTARRAA